MLELLRCLVQAATPFMQHQASPDHFEFLGLDIIADRAGGVWLMEGETRAVAVGMLVALGFALRCRRRPCFGEQPGQWRGRALACLPPLASFLLQGHRTGQSKSVFVLPGCG